MCQNIYRNVERLASGIKGTTHMLPKQSIYDAASKHTHTANTSKHSHLLPNRCLPRAVLVRAKRSQEAEQKRPHLMPPPMPPSRCQCFEGRGEGKKAVRFFSVSARLDQTMRKEKQQTQIWYARNKSSFSGMLSKCARRQHTRQSRVARFPVDFTAKLVHMALRVTYSYVGRREMKGGVGWDYSLSHTTPGQQADNTSSHPTLRTAIRPSAATRKLTPKDQKERESRERDRETEGQTDRQSDRER